MKQAEREPERCAYCGYALATTRDHVIAQCLFERPLPENMITVPACAICNSVKGKHDTFLRDTLVSDIRSGKHPVAQRIAAGPMRRAFERNRSDVARAILKQRTELTLALIPGEDTMAIVAEVDADEPRVQMIIATIVQGLYYHRYKRYLPSECEFEVRFIHPLGVPELRELFERDAHGSPIFISVTEIAFPTSTP